jgi:hypothetical protein
VKSLTGRVKTPKRARVTGHRASRAGVRKELSRQLATLNPVATKPATSKAKPVVSKPAVAPAAPVVANVVATSKATSKTASKTASKKRKLAPAKAAVQAVRFDAAKQRSALSSAKKARLKVGGLSTRRGSHIMAAGKRSQARRDKRR